MSRRCQQWCEFLTAKVLIDKCTKDNDDVIMKHALLEYYCSLVSKITKEEIRTAGVINGERTTVMSNDLQWGRG